MGIKSLFGFGQARDKPVRNYSNGEYSFNFGRSTSGKSVNEMTAMQTTAVYACVRILSEAIASLPIHVYRYKDGGKEMVCDYPLLPGKMSVERDSNGVLYYVYSRYSDENPNIKKMGNITLRQEDVLHIPGLGFDGLIGYSPIAMARNAVGMTMVCEEYGASFFANGANPGGVLKHPGVLKDPAKVMDSWNAVYHGTTNAHKIAVLEEGMKYQQIGIPPEEAQFLETRKFQINEIARLFRIPPHMVGDLEKSSFSNIEQQSLEFMKYTFDITDRRMHHEIYLSDARKVAPEKLKTVIRHPIKRA